jgi:sugar lactone lactonase YvrE
VALAAVLIAMLMLAPAPALALREHVYSSSFGSEGSGEGQFSEPAGVAVSEVGGSSGDVYVVDKGNNRVEVFSSTGTYLSQFDGSVAPTGAFSAPKTIAVDNSANPLDPSSGDVYVTDTGHSVVDKFSSSGTYLGQIVNGAGGGSFGELDGVAVDTEGLVWVYQSSKEIDSYSDAFANEFLAARNSPFGTSPGFAVDSQDNLYVNRGAEVVAKLDSSGMELKSEVDPERTAAAAVDLSNDNVYIDNVITISAFTASGSSIERFGTGHLTGSSGLAIESSSGRVYVADSSAHAVRVFIPILVPDVSTGEASNLQTEGSATLSGTVNPDGVTVTSCKFEYGTGTSYGSIAECPSSPGSGSAPVTVSASLSGLIPATLYHYRLVAGNANGENGGEDRSFTAPRHPAIGGESFSNVGSTTATVSAQINPGGSPTTYHVDYGTSVAYGSSTQETSVGGGLEAASVQVQLSGLQPDTVYHARVVATNVIGTAQGSDLAFTTAAAVTASASTLPDNRVYEMVSPIANADGNVYVPAVASYEESPDEIISSNPYRGSSDGNAVAYAGDPPSTGGNGSVGNGLGNQFVATRATNGWMAVDVSPSHNGERQYKGFSSDLSVGILASFGQPPLTSDAPANCDVLYSRTTSDGAYHAAFTSTQTPGECGFPEFAGISAGNSHLIFESTAALTSNAVEREGHKNLYESVAGQLYLVNVLPNGKPDVNAAYGASPEEESGVVIRNFDHVISSDGSRIVWTDLNTGDLYVRENADSPSAITVQVDASVGGGGRYWAANGDGSRVFFTHAGDLYEYDLNAATTTDLTPGGNVQGVVGVSQDGSYVYFVAAGSLASGAIVGQPNLYVRHDGETKLIATLAPADNAFKGPETNALYGDWRPALQARTAELPPDGRHLVFMSTQSLTGYHNSGLPEVFVYDTGSGQVSCASCNPSGERPVAHGSRLQTSLGNTYLLRSLSEDGSRVFFDSSESLVPEDTNGVQDVYEWERDGTGSCRQNGGCIYLISGNLSSDFSYFVDASASGNDVFLATRAQLVSQDRNGNVDMYDARVNGGFPQLSLECTGTGCQGLPSAPPIFATPSSVTFNGVGNFEPPPKAVVKPKSKPSKCKRGLVRKGGRCVKRKARKSSRRSKRGRK